MTDAELNLAIAKLVYTECEDFWQKYDEARVRINWEDDMGFIHTGKIVDYCNNWNDLMPLVVEHEIALTGSTTKNWWCGYWRSPTLRTINDIQAHHEDPQRALAECLLKVLQENGDD